MDFLGHLGLCTTPCTIAKTQYINKQLSYRFFLYIFNHGPLLFSRDTDLPSLLHSCNVLRTKNSMHDGREGMTAQAATDLEPKIHGVS